MNNICSLVGKLFLFTSAYKPAVSTLLILTFPVFEVDSILDFVQFVTFSNSGFCPIRFFPIRILSNSGFCPIQDFVNSEFCPIRDFVQFGFLYNLRFCFSRFCPFEILSILDFVQFKILSTRDFVHLGILSIWILSNSGFFPFGGLSFPDFVFLDFVQATQNLSMTFV